MTRSAFEEHPFGSRAMGRGERWYKDRTLCLSAYCMYAHACPEAAGRQHYLSAAACLRHHPEGERPAAGLSAVAQQVLQRLRGGV